MKFEIKNRWSGEVVYACELSAEVAGREYSVQMGFAVKQAAAAGANLRSADLRSANLSSADLSSADLSGANLSSADLSGANLSGADLSGANLRSADLRSANLSSADLSGANLSSADLSGAYLSGAYLSGADLSGAYLSGAYLSGANLTPIRDDVWAVLASAPGEAYAVRDALIAGKVDGSTYSGACACLVGTIAKARGTNECGIEGLQPSSSRPAERFFMNIKPGDTPESNQSSALALDWVNDFIARVEAAFDRKVA
ncbi:pentapeptide repeat-containing protein [Lysobacter enzymogenes]|uniref:pentapeptide repeat-containing protein n=1 Tax=Lysobacter enzymogenes TaxID=69 RepID=UPI00384AEE52